MHQLGDIIVAIDNQEINTEADLFKILESHQPGDVIAITAQRWRVYVVVVVGGGCRRSFRVSG